MIKVSVINNANGRQFEGTFNTQGEADAWIDKQKTKTSWGLPERKLQLAEGETVPEEALSTIQTTDQEGNIITEYVMPCQYTITQEDLLATVEQRNAQVVQKRKQEYAKIDHELMEAIVEKELGDSTKMDAYLVKRAAIKAANPKE
jgi:hypothetical protein